MKSTTSRARDNQMNPKSFRLSSACLLLLFTFFLFAFSSFSFSPLDIYVSVSNSAQFANYSWVSWTGAQIVHFKCGSNQQCSSFTASLFLSVCLFLVSWSLSVSVCHSSKKNFVLHSCSFICLYRIYFHFAFAL